MTHGGKLRAARDLGSDWMDSWGRELIVCESALPTHNTCFYKPNNIYLEEGSVMILLEGIKKQNQLIFHQSQYCCLFV